MDLSHLLDPKTVKNYQQPSRSNIKLSFLERFTAKIDNQRLSSAPLKKISGQTDQNRSNDILFSAAIKKLGLTPIRSKTNIQSEQAKNNGNNGQRIGHLFNEGNIGQNQSNYSHAKSDQRVSIYIKDVRFFICHRLLNQKEVYHNL